MGEGALLGDKVAELHSDGNEDLAGGLSSPFQNWFDVERHDLLFVIALRLLLWNASEGRHLRSRLKPCRFFSKSFRRTNPPSLFHRTASLVFGRLENPIKMFQERPHLVQLLKAFGLRSFFALGRT